jgi:hypothetical protein
MFALGYMNFIALAACCGGVAVVLLMFCATHTLPCCVQNSMYGWSEFLKEMKGFYQVSHSMTHAAQRSKQ